MLHARVKLVIKMQPFGRYLLEAQPLQLVGKNWIYLRREDLHWRSHSLDVVGDQKARVSDGDAVHERRVRGQPKPRPPAVAEADDPDTRVLLLGAQGSSDGEDLGLALLTTILGHEACHVDFLPSPAVKSVRVDDLAAEEIRELD